MRMSNATLVELPLPPLPEFLFLRVDKPLSKFPVSAGFSA